MTGVRLWHDDVRQPPDGTWTWARTNAEAVQILKDSTVVECSLDHDLGAAAPGGMSARDAAYLRGSSPDGTGLDLVRWMIGNHCVPPRVTIHSWNPVGARRMARELAAAGQLATMRPFQIGGEQ